MGSFSEWGKTTPFVYIFKVRFKKGFINNNGRRIALKAGYDIIITLPTYRLIKNIHILNVHHKIDKTKNK